MTTYEELRDRCLELHAWLDAADARLRQLTPPSEEGRRIVQAMPLVEREHSAARRAMLNHPDAPPQG